MSASITREQLLAAAKEFGTPLYVYHAERIIEQYRKLQTAFAATDTRIFYACKALTNINILRLLKTIDAPIDCSSINEVKLALHAGHAPENVLYTSNGIAFSEIAEAKELGVNINIDSLSNLEKFGRTYGHSYPVGIRLKPNIMAGGNLKISTGHENSKFGIPVEQIDDVIALMQAHNIHIRGLHIHTGSEIKDVEVFIKGLDVLFELMPRFPELGFIDLGGGFKVPYKDDDEGTDITALGKAIATAFEKVQTTYGKPLQVWFEPGKFIVSEAGYFITEVNVLKHNPQISFAGVNSGFNHLIRPMFYDAFHRIENISNADGVKKTYTITGNICETDNFATDRELTEISEGDLLVFYNAGAYSFEMSSNYNSRYKPAEVLYKDDKAHLIRRRDNFEDLLRNQPSVL